MTFLQPLLLWGLPLALLPILIHLLNRMRYRTMRWAAMSFLFTANRASTRWAKLRQFLILACRALAIAALILAVSRPLAGGWIGWMLSPTPDAILILLDRSASMETKDATGTITRREQALRSLAAAAGSYAERARFVLIESALHQPQEIADPKLLPQLALTSATDTAADIPAMLDTAAEWCARNKTGLTEIWLASDLQRANWHPESGSRWQAITTRIAALPQTVRVRLLALTQAPTQNISVAATDATRRDRAGQPQIDLTLEFQRADDSPMTLPVGVTLDEARSHFDLALQGQSMRVRRVLALDPASAGKGETGWGKIELPADANIRDNTSFFVHGPKPPAHTALIADDEQSRRFLRFAAAPSAQLPQQTCDIISSAEKTDWKKYALVIWQTALPAGNAAQQLQEFVEQGGLVIFFPPGAQSANAFAGVSWGAAENAERDQPFRVSHWDEQDGPLAKSEEGLSLAVGELALLRRQSINAGGEPRASFADAAQPFLTERALGRGSVFFCATLPNAEWSNLSDGRVLVPMLQRLQERGAKRFAASQSIAAGDPTLLENSAGWSSVDSPAKPKDVRVEAGVYRSGARLVAVNRPPDEDTIEVVEKAAVKQLFGPVPLQLFEERGGEGGPLQGEIWRALLIAMLALMLGEAFLSLPMRSVERPPQPIAKTERPRPTAARQEFAETASR